MAPFLAALLAFSKINASNIEWEEYKYQALQYQHEAEGWCNTEKAEKMMNLIYTTRPDICVEIGVFGGSSIYPTAQALKYIGQGVVYAIDPWETSACQVGYDPTDPNYVWWSQVNLQQIYEGFISLLTRHHLTSFCYPMKTTSENALAYFPNNSIDILHLDGNHSEAAALADVHHWLPKVKPGGYIWFDDCNWTSTTKAVSYLKNECSLDLSYSIGNECFLFQKPEIN